MRRIVVRTDPVSANLGDLSPLWPIVRDVAGYLSFASTKPDEPLLIYNLCNKRSPKAPAMATVLTALPAVSLA